MLLKSRKSANAMGRIWVGTISAIAVIAAILVGLYVARPKMTPVGVFIKCVSCTDPTETHLSEDWSHNPPTINIKVKNTGRTRATIVEINTTLYSTIDPDEHPIFEPSHGYRTPFTLDSYSEAVLSQSVNEMILYDMRNPTPARQYERTVVYGHVTYRGPFWFSVTTDFCFQYSRPHQRLPESWAVCSI